MISKIFLMLLICKVNSIVCETAYHYISQVSETTPQTLAPKPLFSPHDPRREGIRSRGVYSYQTGIDRYGTQKYPSVSTEHNLLLDDPSSVFGGNQHLWHPVYTDTQYSGLGGVTPSTYYLSYGVLPEGYEPRIPLRSDPLGYSYTYNAGDHNRQMTSDGRGNFYSSFSFVPPAGSPGPQLQNLPPLDYPKVPKTPSHVLPTLNYGHLSTSRSTFNIAAAHPQKRVYSTLSPVQETYNPSTARSVYASTSSSTLRPIYTISPSLRPLDVTTSGPLNGILLPNPVNDFTNGFNFVAKNYPSKRIPENTFNVNSHALSTNIQHDSLTRESSPSVKATGSRHVTVVPSDLTPIRSRVTTERSYHTLSRSLPLAFSTKRITTISPSSVLSASYSTDSTWSSPLSMKYPNDRTRSSVQTIRNTSRRSTTERAISYSASLRSTTVFPPPSTSKPSVVQKIPRKLKNKNNTAQTDDLVRPNFIDDLTSLAYSHDNVALQNNTIIQIKQGREKSRLSNFSDVNEKTVAIKKFPIQGVSFNNSSRTAVSINNDGYVTGNKTYLAGLGLQTNIHY